MTASQQPPDAEPEPARPGAAGQPAAWVDGVVVPVSTVDAEVARLRSGPAAARLPREGTPDGRQLRRWVTQRVVLRALLDHECTTRALTRAPEAIPADPSVLGTAAADVLTTSATARAVYADVVRDVTVPEAEVRAAHARTRPTRPTRWLVRQAFSRTTPPTALPPTATPVDPATLLPEVRATLPATPGPPRCGSTADARPSLVSSSLGWHLIAVDAVLPAGPVPYAERRDQLSADLTARARQTTFARWLDAQAVIRIRLAPGYEHPADPANPDATHRH